MEEPVFLTEFKRLDLVDRFDVLKELVSEGTIEKGKYDVSMIVVLEECLVTVIDEIRNGIILRDHAPNAETNH